MLATVGCQQTGSRDTADELEKGWKNRECLKCLHRVRPGNDRVRLLSFTSTQDTETLSTALPAAWSAQPTDPAAHRSVATCNCALLQPGSWLACKPYARQSWNNGQPQTALDMASPS